MVVAKTAPVRYHGMIKVGAANDIGLTGGLKRTLSDMWIYGTAETVWEGQASHDHAAPT